MKTIIIIAINCLFIFSIAFAESNIPKISAEDISEGKIVKNELYGSGELWDYINGGADVYLEYGFEKLSAQEIEYRGARFIIRIFRMNSSEAAYGIYSISRITCDSSEAYFDIVSHRIYRNMLRLSHK